MLTDEMLVARFKEIMELITMEEGTIETTYGLRPGNGEGPAYRKGTIVSICKTCIEELEASLAQNAQKQAAEQKKAEERYKAEHYKGVAAGEIPTLNI